MKNTHLARPEGIQVTKSDEYFNLWELRAVAHWCRGACNVGGLRAASCHCSKPQSTSLGRAYTVSRVLKVQTSANSLQTNARRSLQTNAQPAPNQPDSVCQNDSPQLFIKNYLVGTWKN